MPQMINPLLDENTCGWWVPVQQYQQQNLLPKSGAWQDVRTKDGKVYRAIILSGVTYWSDTNYQPIRSVTEWLKPKTWFFSKDDLIGDREKLAALKQKRNSILRSMVS
jgi:hypothetical protein